MRSRCRMTANLSQKPIGDMESARDILRVGWSLYTSNFPQYFKIALVATAWALIPNVFNLLTAVAPTYLETPLSPGIRILLFVVWVAIAIFCTAQSLGQFAGISRLAYQSLSNAAETPREDLRETSRETPEQALRFTRSRKYSFLGASIMQSIIFFLASVALSVLSIIFLVITGVIIGTIAGNANATGNSPIANILLTLVILVWLIAFIYAYLYIFVRFMLIEKPLAIEQESGVFATIERSWQLTKRGLRRSMLVVLSLFLLALAVYLIPTLIAVIVAVPSGAFEVLATESTNPEQVEQLMQALQPFFIVLFVIGIVVSLFLMPLFKTTLTALYLDLRNRFEKRSLPENIAEPSAD